jgi:hypothetical protein
VSISLLLVGSALSAPTPPFKPKWTTTEPNMNVSNERVKSLFACRPQLVDRGRDRGRDRGLNHIALSIILRSHVGRSGSSHVPCLCPQGEYPLSATPKADLTKFPKSYKVDEGEKLCCLNIYHFAKVLHLHFLSL